MDAATEEPHFLKTRLDRGTTKDRLSAERRRIHVGGLDDTSVIYSEKEFGVG